MMKEIVSYCMGRIEFNNSDLVNQMNINFEKTGDGRNEKS